MRVLPLLAAWLLVAPAFTADAAAPPKRPNVLLIVTDDQRPDTIHALGNAAIRTPNLDRLVARGTTFTRAVCAYPICHVSRAELLTGCTAFRAIQPYPDGKLNDALPRLSDTLRDAGYHTAYVGKWHTTGRPSTRGYDDAFGLFASGGNLPLTIPLDRFGKPNTGYRGWVFQTDDGQRFPNRGVGLTPNISEDFAQAAIDFLSKYYLTEPDPNRPFFLHVNFTAPHDPRFTPKGYEKAYAPTLLNLPKNFVPDHPFDHGNQGGRDEVLLPRPLQANEVNIELATYYALIQHLDAQFGRIVSVLENRQALDDTIIIYTSDHGLALGSHGLTGKQNMYEHTINVPLVMAGPGIPADKRNPAQCYLRDLFPTLCDLTDTPTPNGLDGQSLQPVLTGGESELRPFVVGYFTNTQRMIRTDQWKYVRYPQVDREQLFDVVLDPNELHDLSADAEQQERVANLRRRLDVWLKAHGDPLTK